MSNVNITVMRIDFSLSSADETLSLPYGSLELGNGGEVAVAAEWQGITVAEFLEYAIDNYLYDVYAAMEEEIVGES